MPSVTHRDTYTVETFRMDDGEVIAKARRWDGGHVALGYAGTREPAAEPMAANVRDGAIVLAMERADLDAAREATGREKAERNAAEIAPTPLDQRNRQVAENIACTYCNRTIGAGEHDGPLVEQAREVMTRSLTARADFGDLAARAALAGAPMDLQKRERVRRGQDAAIASGEELPVEPSAYECLGHPAGPDDPMGETAYCDGSCRQVADVDVEAAARARANA